MNNVPAASSSKRRTLNGKYNCRNSNNNNVLPQAVRENDRLSNCDNSNNNNVCREQCARTTDSAIATTATRTRIITL